jgi:glucosamine 6-phosphate synthetase-like amidotransferase/phosphosugar isomerase protein
MCGLFGFSNYSGDRPKNLSSLASSLAVESAVRGTDATGVAFCRFGDVIISKESKDAYRMDFKCCDDACALIGHTRHSTQGSEKKNYNNHPFSGKCRGSRFALAHNGVLSNDRELRKSLHLPKTKIETDSYIAVQLIESRKKLNFDTIKYMAEKIDGSYSFSILDDRDNIYLVKGDSPLSVMHFPGRKMYVYASTDEILYRALIDSPLFSSLKKGEFEMVDIKEGDIVKICSEGKLEYGKFEHSCYYGRAWWDYSFSAHEDRATLRDEYIRDIKTFAAYQGMEPESIDDLIKSGFTLDEIEEFVYGY